jgi:two-component system sensor histidine kinase KdpD
MRENWKFRLPFRREYLAFSLRGAALTLAFLAGAGLCCLLLQFWGSDTGYANMIFILAVFLTARFTDGYLFGIFASLLGVLAVNYLFTYPYFEFNFTLEGYPLTILCMLVVSLTTSALTTQSKQSEKLQLEADTEKARGNLLRAVSHDLRTPLTSILGATSAVIENDAALTSEARIRLLQSAQEDARWLIRMVENLLTVTRFDAEGKATIVKRPEVVEEVLAESIAKFRKNFPDIPVSASVPAEPLLVPMDAMLIGQVLFNLLENAALHGITTTQIDVSVRRAGDQAVFCVEDNGVGIAPEKLPLLFSSHLAASDDSDSHKNMGIGLSVCSTIVKAHGGRMSAENRPTGGARFWFALQLDTEENTHAE